MTISFRVLLTAVCMTACSIGTFAFAGEGQVRSESRQDEGPLARFIAQRGKGYRAHPCGFDMNRNGILDEEADRLVGDGRTADPDGDGVDEDFLYVDSEQGNDETGYGSSDRPFRTIQKALDTADGPEDGAEDVICISGTFHETLTMHHGGAAGHYVRDGFQFPKNPTMIVGWDKDGDGHYPPYDKDDTAVLDGEGTLGWAIDNRQKLSHVEIAHLTVKNNVISGAGEGCNIAADYAPRDFVADENVYDPDARFRWDNSKHWESISFADWQNATNQDPNSKSGTPPVVDAASAIPAP